MNLIERVKEAYRTGADIYDSLSRGFDSEMTYDEFFESVYGRRLELRRVTTIQNVGKFDWYAGLLLAAIEFVIKEPIKSFRIIYEEYTPKK